MGLEKALHTFKVSWNFSYINTKFLRRLMSGPCLGCSSKYHIAVNDLKNICNVCEPDGIDWKTGEIKEKFKCFKIM